MALRGRAIAYVGPTRRAPPRSLRSSRGDNHAGGPCSHKRRSERPSRATCDAAMRSHGLPKKLRTVTSVISSSHGRSKPPIYAPCSRVAEDQVGARVGDHGGRHLTDLRRAGWAVHDQQCTRVGWIQTAGMSSPACRRCRLRTASAYRPTETCPDRRPA